MTTVLVSVGHKWLAAALVLVFVGTIATTYTLFVEQKLGPAFLPTISNTWEYPPGSYLSRLTVSLGGLVFYFCNTSLYFIIGGADAPDPAAGFPTNGTMYVFAQLAVFCLTWVGVGSRGR